MPSVDRQPRAASDAPGRQAYPLTIAMAAVTCALAPAYTVRWHYGFYPTTLLETFIFLTVLVFAAETIRQGSSIGWRTPFTLAALVFILAGTVSVAVATDRRAALGLYRAYLLEPIAFFFVVGAAARTVRRAYVIVAGLGVAALVLGVANGLVVLQAIADHRLDLAGTPPVVIYQTSNAVALFMLPVMVIAASVVVYARQPRERIVCGIFLAITLPAFLLTFSRGGYLALFAVLLGLALSHRRRVQLVGLAAAAIVVFVLLPPIRERLAHELDPSDPNNTLVGRTYLWRATLQMLQHRPLTGAGLSGFASGIAPYWNATHTDRFIYPHNLLLNFWSETGVLGVIAFGWILIKAFLVSWKGWRHGALAWRGLQLGVFLALVGFVVHGLVDVPYFKNDLSLEFWALVGVSWAGRRWASAADET